MDPRFPFSEEGENDCNPHQMSGSDRSMFGVGVEQDGDNKHGIPIQLKSSLGGRERISAKIQKIRSAERDYHMWGYGSSAPHLPKEDKKRKTREEPGRPIFARIERLIKRNGGK